MAQAVSASPKTASVPHLPADGGIQTRWLSRQVRWDGSDYVMMRDPAIPVEVTADHRLYPAEVDVLMTVWAERLLTSEGVHLVHREDTQALDQLMPVGLYADRYHFLPWSRLGIVLVEGMRLP